MYVWGCHLGTLLYVLIICLYFVSYTIESDGIAMHVSSILCYSNNILVTPPSYVASSYSFMSNSCNQQLVIFPQNTSAPFSPDTSASWYHVYYVKLHRHFFHFMCSTWNGHASYLQLCSIFDFLISPYVHSKFILVLSVP